MAENKTLTFGIKIPTETNADETASSVDQLRKKISESQEAVKAYSSSLRNLKGSSAEVKEAKEKLKAAVNAERESISRATLALGKHGVTVHDTSKKVKDAAKSVSQLRAGISAVGGPAAEATAKLDTLKSLLSGVTSGAGLAALGAAALVAAFALVGVGIAAAAVSLTKFILESGNALRSQNLFREAASGSAENAKALGHQIEALGRKVPQTRAELNEMGVGLTRTFINTRVSGQGLVDTFNAVAQTSAAMGDSAGKAIEDIISRGKQMGRFGMNINELQNTGITFDDVAMQLSKSMKISLADAKNQLFMGRVDINAGAKALRGAVEKNFGEINARKMLDLDVMANKFRDTLSKLTENVNLKPVLEGFARLGKLFDDTTPTGAALKQMVTTFGNTVGKVFEASLPSVEIFFKTFVLEALKFEIALLRLGLWVQKTFGVDFKSAFGDGSTAIFLAKAAFATLTATVLVFGAVVAAIGATFYYGLVYPAKNAVQGVKDAFNYDWSALGTNIIGGLLSGIASMKKKVTDSIDGIADSIKGAFTGKLKIHSPSRVFEDYGHNTTQGYVQGIERSSSKAQEAITDMVAMPKGDGAIPTAIPPPQGIGGGGSNTNTFNISISVDASGGKGDAGEDAKRALMSPSFKGQFIKMLEEMMIGAGMPTQTPKGAV